MAEFDRVLRENQLRAFLQPIVALDGGEVVGYEGLIRGPEGSEFQMPDRLFAEARRQDRLAELDALCVEASLAAAQAARLEHPAALFVNVEPETFDGPPPADVRGFKVVVEITERALTARPAELLRAVESVRRRGWGIAVDDVGADWRSLALMPFLRPDVVKLDRGVLADAASPEAARIVRGSQAQLTAHGGILLAEGIEEAEHERRAVAFGARLGQGWRYGRPEPLEASRASRRQPGVRIVQPRAPIGPETPFQLLRRRGIVPGVATKAELLALSVDLEIESRDSRDPAVILATFQDAAKFTPRTRERYTRLAKGAAFVGVFGVGLTPEPVPGVRGARLEDGEALRDEWTVVVVRPGATHALIARDLGDVGGEDLRRRFEYVLSDDPDLVLAAGRALMLRIAAETPERPSFRVGVTKAPLEAAGVASAGAERIGAR